MVPTPKLNRAWCIHGRLQNHERRGGGCWEQGSCTELVLDSHALVFQAEIRAIAEFAAV